MGNPISSAAVGARYMESNDGMRGDRMAGSASDSEMTFHRKLAEKNITQAASDNGVSVADVVTTVLKDNEDKLQFYIASKGETPNGTLAGLIVQAALLRADDIATLSNAANLSEDEALKEIEAAESQAVNDNTADVDSILPASANAALKIVVDEFQTKMNGSTGSKNLKGSIGIVRNFLATPLSATPAFQGGMTADNFSLGSIVNMQANKTNSAIGDDGDDSDDEDDDNIPTRIDVGSLGLAPINIAAPTTQVDAPTTISGVTTISASAPIATDWSSILTGIAATAKTVSGAITGTTTALSGSLSNIGANSIQTYVSKNWISLLLAAIVIIVLVIFISRGLKNK